MVIENLRLLFERQLADIDYGAAVSELGKVALSEPTPAMIGLVRRIRAKEHDE